jgi:hypothetical protein
MMILRDKKQTNAKPICVFLAAITDAPIIVVYTNAALSSPIILAPPTT